MAKEGDSMYKDDSTPKWLKTIQLNSWEAELLISALVLYALFQVPDYLDDFSDRNFHRGSYFILIFNVLERSIQFLQLGYILHIMVRGVWVASVGFSYVFPSGINAKNLKFKGKFKKELDNNPSLIKNVLRLEELSSMIYGLSFTLFGCFLGLSMLMFFFGFVYNFTSPYSPNSVIENPTFFGFFTILYVVCLILLFIDFITSGLFRRKEWAIDWFYPIAWFFRIITLSFLYRRSMLVLVSNLKGWKARLVSLVITVIVGGFLYTQDKAGDRRVDSYFEKTLNTEFISGNYENLRSNGDYLVSSIQSDIISDSYIKVFLRDVSVFGSMHDSKFDRDEIKWDQMSSDSSSYFLNKWLEVSIDANPVTNIKWVNAQHPSTKIFGFFAYIDIENIERGSHNLIIGFDSSGFNQREKNAHEGSIYKDNPLLANILFLYDKQ